MTPPRPDDVEQITLLLQQMKAGDPAAEAGLLPRLYDELRRVAQAQIGRERASHTLQATALVHEAYLRVFGNRQQFASGREFFGAAANTMRRILVDHARTRGRHKRGGGKVCVPVDALELATRNDTDQLLALDDAVSELERQDPRLAEQAKLRLFAGFDEADVALALE
ncbi:MAG: RNA polymerase subunit sigma, partial [Planctomycetes bacterium]|nr:RNA polymerase subunit sigma [Planctomycetota bacterium]